MDISQNNKKKVIALYLPQFHTIPENDKWWGEGFTEWTNTRKAKPLFEGHEQPKTPFNENYYDLSDVTVMERQAALAKQYGVFGFCYYHYWFKNGKKLLEKPLEQMLADPKVDIPFCLCWANENWSRNWDGGNREIIMEQDYGKEEDWKLHFDYLLQFFKDKRYMTWNNAPILVIYRPEEISQFNKMREYMESLAIKAGFSGLTILSQFPEAYFDSSAANLKIDYQIKFEPLMARHMQYYGEYDGSFIKKVENSVKSTFKTLHARKALHVLKKAKANISKHSDSLTIMDYDEIWDIILNKEPTGENLISGGFTAWDNTARNVCGTVIHGSTPDKFGHYMRQLLEKDSAMQLVFVNAWNEWAEGAYLEPDERHKYAYLEALEKAVRNDK